MLVVKVNQTVIQFESIKILDNLQKFSIDFNVTVLFFRQLYLCSFLITSNGFDIKFTLQSFIYHFTK
jgi:hypothetical protein